MPYSISTLLIRNLRDVFGENDPARRRAAIDEIYTEDCVFYDPSKGVYRGRDEIDRIAGAIKATHPEFRYQPITEPAESGNGGLVRWVSGRPDRRRLSLFRQATVSWPPPCDKAGNHAFRRFRNTYLRNHTACPDGLIKFWLGHADKDMTDRYDKIREDTTFRKDVAERCGFGFKLPGMVPNVPNCVEETEVENVVQVI